MSFKVCFFSILSSAGHFVQPRGNYLSNIGRGPLEKHYCSNILKSGHLSRTRSFEDFLFLTLAVILFNGAGPLRPSWISDRHNFSSFRSKSHAIATEQDSAQTDTRFGKRCRKSIFKMAAVAAILDFLSVHLAILCLLGTLMLIIKFRFNWIIEELSKMWILNIFPI